MDDVDLAILQHVGVAPFLGPPRRREDGTPSALAKTLGISVETVRRRLDALRAEGVLAGRGVWPNLRLLNRTASSHHYQLAASIRKPDAVAAAAREPGVLAVYEFIGRDVCVDIVHADDADRLRLTARLQALFGAPGMAMLDVPLPTPQRALTQLDWRILRAVQGDVDQDLGDVAKRLHVSRRTVVRRLQAMEDQGAFDVAGHFDPSRLHGYLLAYLLIRMARPVGATERKAILESLQTRWLAQWSPPDAQLAHLVVVLAARSPRDLEDVRRETESLSGVESVEALLVHQVTSGPAWMDDAVEQQEALAVAAPRSKLPRRKLVQNATRRA